MTILAEENYHKLTPSLEMVSFNHLFADAVINGRVKGRVYVDNTQAPQTAYIVHPYGMSLLLGDCSNQRFNRAFKAYALNLAETRNGFEWMQAYPAGWDTFLPDLFGDTLVKSADNNDRPERPVIQLNTRVNFRFNKLKFLNTHPNKPASDGQIEIVQNPRDVYKDMQGSVVPANFWDSGEDFARYGVAFSLYYNGKLASTAFSSFRSDSELELGIETGATYRGLGLAEMACAPLIRYCLGNNLEPVWACRLENTGSYKLAEKLGFEPALQIPYYRLSN